jgi:hypothetical protein
MVGMKRVDGIDYAGDGKDWRQWGRCDGVLEGERGLDSALPEAGEEHEEETELSEQERRPYARLGEHVD